MAGPREILFFLFLVKFLGLLTGKDGGCDIMAKEVEARGGDGGEEGEKRQLGGRRCHRGRGRLGRCRW